VVFGTVQGQTIGLYPVPDPMELITIFLYMAVAALCVNRLVETYQQDNRKPPSRGDEQDGE
jgi:hypothetical protein